MSDVDIADSIIRAAALSITQYSAEAASKELPWDGYSGLVRICDDENLREQGVVRAITHQPKIAEIRHDIPQPCSGNPDRSQFLTSGTTEYSNPARRNGPLATASHATSVKHLCSRHVPENDHDVCNLGPRGGIPSISNPSESSRGGLTQTIDDNTINSCKEVDVPSATAAVMMAHAQAGAADPGLGLAEASTTRASAPQQDATADPRAHRRVPSWVHEYVLGVEEDPAGRDDRAEAACNSAPTTGSGRAAALGLQDVAGTGWSLWTSPSNLTRSSQPQQQQPGRRAAASVTTALLLRRAAPELDLSWVAKLPTPPTNKPLRK